KTIGAFKSGSGERSAFSSFIVGKSGDRIHLPYNLLAVALKLLSNPWISFTMVLLLAALCRFDCSATVQAQ
ncbi:MAG TPA: hypothetical protein PL187_18440, partial [Caldilinea sp.]|nr:hypothetical protein [Caldilinea sp.]